MMGGKSMFTRIKLAVAGAASSLAVVAALAPAAHADILSAVLPGTCGSQPESQPFARWGDLNSYTPVPGGSFESGTPSWSLSGGAKVVSGNESYKVAGGSHSLSLPAGSSATSPVLCTGVDHPSARLFVRNTGSSSSRLNVWATYPPVIGLLPDKVYLGDLTASGAWQPSSYLEMGLLNNTIGSLNLGETTVSFTFAPADGTGNWSIDDVYLDPRCRM
jgi:hypothetical protein